jgi:hypothetical protein
MVGQPHAIAGTAEHMALGDHRRSGDHQDDGSATASADGARAVEGGREMHVVPCTGEQTAFQDRGEKALGGSME